MVANTYYHSDTCNLPDLEEPFKCKPHLGGMLKGRRWAKVKAKLKKEGRPKGLKSRQRKGRTKR